MEKKNLHEGHRDRLRKKFMTLGAEALLEHELLELILFYAIPRVNTNDIAHNLINRFENLNGILNADTDELTQVKGIGKTSAEFLKLLADICKEYNNFSTESVSVLSVDSLSDYFTNYFKNSNAGVCLILGIDNNLRITCKYSFTEISLIRSNAEIRRIIELLIKNNCTKIAVGINHPERSAVPDNRDFILARNLAEKLSVLGISLIDCIICNEKSTFSMKKSGAFTFF
ncbi:MAG: hypothetical protein NC340_04410 [Ruminococcus flavefaciens]|nr:hypothetical protein [Ruminococcus flavefaciens]MCM1229093.1 hypothetical protein [Ruminococcus flavefaciens]